MTVLYCFIKDYFKLIKLFFVKTCRNLSNECITKNHETLKLPKPTSAVSLATILLMKVQIATTSSVEAGVTIQKKKKNSFPPTRETFTGLFRLVSVARDLWLVPP